MLCPQRTTLNPGTILEATRLPHHANPSRAAGSFNGQDRPCRKAPKYVIEKRDRRSQKQSFSQLGWSGPSEDRWPERARGATHIVSLSGRSFGIQWRALHPVPPEGIRSAVRLSLDC